MALDVASSGLGSFAGKHAKTAGMTFSAMPNGTCLAKKEESFWVPPAISASGWEQRLTNRFDDPTYYDA